MAVVAANASGQVAAFWYSYHEQMLASPDARLATNNWFVDDFWREVFEAEATWNLPTSTWRESYIQDNPNAPTGRAAFVDFFSKNVAPELIAPRIKARNVASHPDGDGDAGLRARPSLIRSILRRNILSPCSTCLAGRRKNSGALGRRPPEAMTHANHCRNDLLRIDHLGALSAIALAVTSTAFPPVGKWSLRHPCRVAGP